MPNTGSEPKSRLRVSFEPKGLLLALLVWILLSLVSLNGYWQLLERKGFDLLSVYTAPMRSTLPITIVGIDEPSFAEIGLRWPWPRGLHAELVDKLTQAGAAVIAFDLIMDVASTPDQDRQLADAIKQAGNIVLAADLVFQENSYVRQWLRVDPFHEFAQAGAASGLATLTLDGDMVVRQLPENREALWRVIVDKFNQARPGMLPQVALPQKAMIRYLGPDHTFPYVSYYQAIDPDKYLPKDFFRDQIVLVGRDTKASPEAGAAQADTFSTPFTATTKWLTPGVELHANILENMIRDMALRMPHPTASYALLTLTILLSWLGMRRWRPIMSAILGILIIGSTGLLDWWLFRYHNIWLPIILPVASVLLMYGGQGGIAHYTEQRRRRQIKLAFEYYVPSQVVAEIIAHPERLKLGGQKQDITMLFTDLEGFTSISEQMSPEAVAQLLNHHLTEMTHIILRHGGTVDKFIGDAIMAFWGAPLPDSQQAAHACLTAQEMQAAMSVIREKLISDGLPPLNMRIGIHSGSAIVGNMGSSKRFNYSAIGDSVNLASRLEGINKFYGTRILLSESTAVQLSADFLLRQVDTVIVKGKLEPIKIFTFSSNARINLLSHQAIIAYQSLQWDHSEFLWCEILEFSPGDSIALLYIERIRNFREKPPPPDWEGAISLEKM